MRHRRHPPDPTRALSLAASLFLIAIQTGGTWANPTPETPDHLSPRQLEQLDALQAQIQALKGHVLGMEGKLRESATSRKAADQARMEAERHLAEQLQEVERLQLERTGLETRLTEKDDEITELQANNLELLAEREALSKRIAEHEAEIARLDRELEISIQSRTETEARLSELLEQLPSSEGGHLTPTAARAAATEAFASLQERRKDSGGSVDPDAPDSVQSAEKAFHRSQLRLANAISAQCVYRVRPKDTLAQISNRFYGDSSQWHKVFEANRHLLEDPNRLAPGITLVIP